MLKTIEKKYKSKNLFPNFIFLIFWGLVTYYLFLLSSVKHLDSVFLFEAAISVWQDGIPNSMSAPSIWDYLQQIVTVPIQEVCISPLKEVFSRPYNILENHAYFVIYPIALLAKLFGSELTFSLLRAAAYTAILYSISTYFRKEKINFLSILVFILIVVFYPGYSGGLLGDEYLDRLYIPFALLALFQVNLIVQNCGAITQADFYKFIVFIVLGSICTERGAIMMIGLLLFYFGFYPVIRKNKNLRILFLGLITVLLLYLYCYFKFFHGNINGGSLSDHFFTTNLNSPLVKTFFLVNFLFLGVFSLFSGWRNIVLCLGAISPQLFFSIGGAELTGWSTHYHSMYIPFLIFSSTIGYVKIYSFLNSTVSRNFFALIIFLYSLFIVTHLNIGSGQFRFNNFAPIKDGFIGQILQFYLDTNNSSVKRAQITFERISGQIPEGAKVSTIESAMPSTYKNRSLNLFPIGMDQADFLIVGGAATNGVPHNITGATSFLGQVETDDLNECILRNRIINKFSLIDNFWGILIFKRN